MVNQYNTFTFLMCLGQFYETGVLRVTTIFQPIKAHEIFIWFDPHTDCQ